MRKMTAPMAMLAIVANGPLLAAPDSGLLLHDTGIGPRGTGVGVSAQIRIKLGNTHTTRKVDRVKLGISAGPVAVIPNISAAGGLTRSTPSLAGFEFKPGYSASFNFAGQSVLVDKGRLNAVDNKSDEGDDKQSTGDKIAWVAAVAGGAMLLVGGVLYSKLESGDFSD